MKRFAGALLLLLGGAAGAARWVDLTRLTDVNTGFAAAGSVWLRYGLLAALLLLAVPACFMAVGRPAALERRSPVLGTGFVLCAVLLCAVAVVQLLSFAGHVTVSGLPLGVLGLVAALWLAVLGMGWLRAERRRPAGGVRLGIAGSLLFVAMAITRFASNYSSYYRVGTVVTVFAALSAVLFAARLIRATQYPESRPGRKLCLDGLLCYDLCTCMELPQALFSFRTGAISAAALITVLAMAGIGLLGAVCAMCCFGEDVVPVKE